MTWCVLRLMELRVHDVRDAKQGQHHPLPPALPEYLWSY
jgi:hypothetical protein